MGWGMKIGILWGNSYQLNILKEIEEDPQNVNAYNFPNCLEYIKEDLQKRNYVYKYLWYQIDKKRRQVKVEYGSHVFYYYINY